MPHPKSLSEREGLPAKKRTTRNLQLPKLPYINACKILKP